MKVVKATLLSHVIIHLPPSFCPDAKQPLSYIDMENHRLNATRCLAGTAWNLMISYDLTFEGSYIYKHCVSFVRAQFVQLHVALRFSLQLSLPPQICRLCLGTWSLPQVARLGAEGLAVPSFGGRAIRRLLARFCSAWPGRVRLCEAIPHLRTVIFISHLMRNKVKVG